MLTELRIQNFKAWRDTGSVRMAPLTVIFGANSAGKSSLGHLLLALKQTARLTDRKRALHLGDLQSDIDLGTFADCLYRHDLKAKRMFTLGWKPPEGVVISNPLDEQATYTGEALRLESTLRADERGLPVLESFRYALLVDGTAALTVEHGTAEGGKPSLTVTPMRLVMKHGRKWPIEPPEKFYRFSDVTLARYQNADALAQLPLEVERLLEGLIYLGPLREPPRRTYAWAGDEVPNVGVRGEFAIAALLAAADAGRELNRGYKQRRQRFDAFIAAWLKDLGVIDTFAVRPIAKGRKEYEVVVRSRPQAPEVKLTDVGFGVSQVLPALVQAFYAPAHSTVWMEQPEIHLHPRVQAELADALISAAPTYAQSGVLGQALFMRTVLLLDRLDAVDVQAALQAWRAITPEAGKFPSDDLRLLLEAADMIGDDYAREFAESIWQQRGHEALDLLLSPARLQRSAFLRGALYQHALDPSTPRADRRRIWFAVIPALLQAREVDAAAHGLDALEELAESDEGLVETMQFLATPANYDPAWSEQDALWVQLRLARRAGDDAAAARYLQWLFYRVRDSDVDLAQQIAEAATAWRLSQDMVAQLQAALPSAPEEPPHADAESRLRAGECVRVVFVGGNETQAQYDERIRQALAREYSGLTVSFRHTGWTSNWGQQVAGLVKECNAADAVVLMTMMRTGLGRALREQLQRPWVSCAARGEMGLTRSIVKAASIALAARGNGALARR